MPELINKIADKGTGKTILLVVQANLRFVQPALELASILSATNRAVVFEISAFDENTWNSRAEALVESLAIHKIRFACVAGFGNAASLVQYLYLALPKSVRSLVLVDATTRPHPSSWTLLISKLEEVLPIGLPLRSKDSVFNSKPFLQRFRCPCLVLSTSSATQHQLSEAQTLLDTLPTAWGDAINWSNFTSEISQKIIDFQNVAAKCPQKTLPQSTSINGAV